MKLCVALDLPNKNEILSLVKQLKGFDIWLKIGLRSFIRDGEGLIKSIQDLDNNFKIFLDLKLYDIPNTLSDAACEIASLGVDMLNIHASSGMLAMKMTKEKLSHFKNPPLILAVTALTSFDEDSFKQIYHAPLRSTALEFATLSFIQGLDGVVCSVHESLDIKKATNEHFITLTPGIRPFGENTDDQKRVADLSMAKANKSDFIVVGRPIIQNADPRSIVEKIIQNI